MLIASVEYIFIFILNMIGLAIFGVGAYVVLKRQINETVVGFMELFTGQITDPKVTRAMTILGKESGKVRAQDATTDALATKILDAPALKGLKMGAKAALGIDVDEFIEDYGAVETIAGLQELGNLLGFDVTKLLSGGAKGLNITTPSSSTTSTEYLKG